MKLLLMLCCIALGISLNAQNLVGYYDSEKKLYGYKDSGQKIVITPMYDLALDFKEGLGLVKVKDKYGFINAKNSAVIPVVLHDAQPFSEGIAVVADAVSYYFIDKTGKKKFPQTFIDAWTFSDGMASVMNKDSLWGYINNAGILTIPYQYSSAGLFGEGIAFVQKQQGKWIAITKKNEVEFEKDAIRIWSYKNGCAAIQLTENRKYNYADEWNFLNKKGELISNSHFSGVDNFDGSTAFVRNYDKQTRNLNYGLINQTGKLVIPVAYTYLVKYGKGFVFANEEGMYPEWTGYIDSAFAVITTPTYKFLGLFGDSLFLVRVKDNNKKYNLLNSKGKELIPLSYQSYDYYDHKKYPILIFYTNYGSSIPGKTYGIKTGFIGSELLLPEMKYEIFVDTKGYSQHAIMDLTGKGILDKSFKVLYHASYRNIGADDDKYEKVKRGFPAPAYGKDSTWYFDKKTKKLTKLKYFVFDKDDFCEGMLRVTTNFLANEYTTDKNTKFGFIDSTLNLVIPITLNNVDNFKEGRARFLKMKPDGYTGLYGFIDKKGIEVIKSQYKNATTFENGYSLVTLETKNDAVIVIDKAGKIKTTIDGVKFDFMMLATKEGLIIAESIEGKLGIWNLQGQSVVPAIYDTNKGEYASLPYFDKDGNVALKKDGKTFYFDKTGKAI